LETEPRKASEVLLEIEKKLDTALGIIHVQDLNIKILSNKLNSIIELLEKQTTAPQRIIVEAVNTTRQPSPPADLERQIPISGEFALPVENSPNGFRRTSRPETFSGDNSYLPQPSNTTPKYPTQIPKAPPGRVAPNSPPPGREVNAEVVVPPTVNVKPSAKTQNIVQNAIPISQRVVSKEGKSLFLADVEIIDLATMQSIFKTRTNGTGKWSASLGVGNYRIIINKRESSTGGSLSATQDIQINGSESKVDLQTIIISS
jgi:hypothetical protein